ncbi:hypothetical protein ACF08N_08950 [Streptomyces sp. NPDC015127]|uniref:hypothetical protein n=1 Tax=Streptomyces sp. NPDC015127 TaxID=3364939 RepID=UPI00370238BA
MEQEDETPQPGDQGAQPPDAGSTVCSNCGATADGPPVTWTCSVENGVRHYLCEDCARANIRAIEGRLDSAWW